MPGLAEIAGMGKVDNGGRQSPVGRFDKDFVVFYLLFIQ